MSAPSSSNNRLDAQLSSSEEPVSGKQGGSGEPFDAGNADEQADVSSSSSASSVSASKSEPISGAQGAGVAGIEKGQPYDRGNERGQN